MASLYSNHWASKPRGADVLSLAVKGADWIKIYREHPEWFDLDLLSGRDKVELLSKHYRLFKDKFDASKFPQNHAVDLFIRVPKRYRYLLDFDRLTRANVGEIARRKPKLLAEYDVPLKMDFVDWRYLFNQHPEYIDKYFLGAHANNATDMRQFMEIYPKYFSKLTPALIEQSPMSAKEWLLHFGRCKRVNSRIRISQPVWRMIQTEIAVEVLCGKSTNSKVLSNALAQMTEGGYT